MNLDWNLISGAIVLGIFSGGVYALMASGLTLTFGVMDIINVAQGAFVILGAYLSFWLEQHLGIDIFLSLLVTMPVMFGLGIGLEVAFIRPLRHERTMFSILVTFAIALVIEGILGKIFTTNFVGLGTNDWYVNDSFKIGATYVAYIYLFGFLLSAGLLSALYVLLYRTTFGRALRATVQNRTAAQLIGINVERISAITFGIGISFAAAGGMVFGATQSFDPSSHYDLISRLLAIIILGGMGSLAGTLIASLLMLVVFDVTSVVYSPTWGTTAFFVLLALILLFRPQGFLGQLEARRQ
jgi:branched-chain amino acid transport system permease protein